MKIDISIGELVDKLTILSIKLEKINKPEKIKNIEKEYNILLKPMTECGIGVDSKEFTDLRSVNLRLWEIEDDIRIKESRQEFDDEFIQLARKVYFVNDDRATIKREINVTYGSELIEEKEYVDYKAGN